MPDCPDKDDCRYAGTECWHCRSETGDPADNDWYENKPSFDENDANPLKTALQLAPQSTNSIRAGQCHPLQQLILTSHHYLPFAAMSLTAAAGRYRGTTR